MLRGLIGRATSGALAGQEVWLDKFYHHLFASDRQAISLIEGSGLAEALEWRRPLTVTLRGGQVYQLDDPASVLKFPPISMPSRLRMAAALAILKALPSPLPPRVLRAFFGGWERWCFPECF